MISASYFDGRSGKRHLVDLAVTSENIDLLGDDVARSMPRHSAELCEPLEGAPCILRFPDGSRCEIHQPASKETLQAALRYRKSFVQLWQERWLGALLAVGAMLFLAFAAWYWGISWAVERAAPVVPAAWEKRIGDEALAGLDRSLLQPTGLSDERMDEARRVFERMLPPKTRMPIRLEFRRAPTLGPNALALPNGTIVVTDAMMMHITGVGSGLTGSLADEFAGVLAHEIGHIENRHSLKKIIEGSLTSVLAWTLFGDFSSVAAGAPAIALQLQYSRAMETEADDYAAALLAQRGIAPSHLADVFDSLERKYRQHPAAQLPSWLRKSTDYMSTHPASEERSVRLRHVAGTAGTAGTD